MYSVPNFLIAFLLWVFSRMHAMRELLATGANECRALIGTMVAAAAKAKPPRSREGPPRDQAHRGEWDFDSKQMRGRNACFCDRC
jgi:hypothetical protein